MAQGRGRGTCLWPNVKFFLEALFICNNINTNLNKNFHTYLSYHSFKPLFLFFQISARSSLKKFANEKWPKAGYLPLICINKPTVLNGKAVKHAKWNFAHCFIIVFHFS